MATCLDEALKLDYLNGLLSEKDRIRFEEHLAACPGCRREIVELRNTVISLSGLTHPPVPAAWTAAVMDRLRAESPSSVSPALADPVRFRQRTNVFLYAVVSTGVTATVALLLWLVMGGMVQRWLPGLSTAALGISDPNAARTVGMVTWILSLHALIFVPSIIDNIYRLVRGGGRRSHPRPSAGFFAC